MTQGSTGNQIEPIFEQLFMEIAGSFQFVDGAEDLVAEHLKRATESVRAHGAAKRAEALNSAAKKLDAAMRHMARIAHGNNIKIVTPPILHNFINAKCPVEPFSANGSGKIVPRLVEREWMAREYQREWERRKEN